MGLERGEGEGDQREEKEEEGERWRWKISAAHFFGGKGVLGEENGGRCLHWGRRRSSMEERRWSDDEFHYFKGGVEYDLLV